MLRRTLCLLLPLLSMGSGCPSQESQTTLVPDNPFGHTPVVQTQSMAAPQGSLEVAARVDTIGRQIVKANQKELGMQPLFRTLGVAQPEIFHQGASAVVVSEGLVKQCATDGQLAAVLCTELGKMVAQRQALAGPQDRLPAGAPPLDVRIGGDNTTAFGPADQVYRAEQAKFDEERRRRADTAPQAEPQALAQTYLTKAGFPASDLGAATPVLQAAAENNTFAKQLAAPVQAGM